MLTMRRSKEQGNAHHGWLDIHGAVSVHGERLPTGNAVAVESEDVLKIAAQGVSKSEILHFDLQ